MFGDSSTTTECAKFHLTSSPPSPPFPPPPSTAPHSPPLWTSLPTKRSCLPLRSCLSPPLDCLWSRQRLPSHYGLGPDPAQPSSCICPTSATRFQQHPPSPSCRHLRRSLSVFSFCLLPRPSTSPNFSCRIGRHQRFFLLLRKRPDLAQHQASASHPSSHPNTGFPSSQ